MFSLVPNWIYESVSQLTYQRLQEMGIDVLLMDFDNTIVPYTNDVPTENVQQWLAQITASDIRLCVVSNTKRGRAVDFCRRFGIDCITRAKKPFQRGIREALRRYGGDGKKIALVGDQIFTDVLGANCGGIISILVKPIDLHNIWLKLRHVLELPFIAIGKGRVRRGTNCKIS